MLEAMKALAEKSVMERVVLLVNHVISAEPQAMDRLRTHASRTIRIELDGWPTMLPAPFPLAFRITPPGLIERIEVPGPMTPDLRVGIAVSNPALVLAKLVVGERPAITVDGDAAFATDVNWLIENLRWDIQDDLARLVGDAPAREIARFGDAVAKALREGAKKLDEFARRAEPRTERPAAEPPPR
jgi:ubiquinone biosynthesis accessory factor UbiJ